MKSVFLIISEDCRGLRRLTAQGVSRYGVVGREATMTGDQEIIAALNDLLAQELSAIDQYLVQAHMLDDWGYGKLHERIAHEAEDERGHVALLIKRVLFLGGVPDVASRVALRIGKDPKEILESDLELEIKVASALNTAMALCRNKGDNGTRAMLEVLLKDTENDHILWFETQLRLIEALGQEAYLAEQL